jgi:hypothetical protein
MSLCLRILAFLVILQAVVDSAYPDANTEMPFISYIKTLDNELSRPENEALGHYNYSPAPQINNKGRRDIEDRLQQHPSADHIRNSGTNRNQVRYSKQNLHKNQPADQNPPRTEMADSQAYDIELEERKMFRIKQIQIQILQQLHLDSVPNVTGIVESSNPVIKELKERINDSNQNMTRDKNYQQDMPKKFSDKKIFIPVEDRKSNIKVYVTYLNVFKLKIISHDSNYKF